MVKEGPATERRGALSTKTLAGSMGRAPTYRQAGSRQQLGLHQAPEPRDSHTETEAVNSIDCPFSSRSLAVGGEGVREPNFCCSDLWG